MLRAPIVLMALLAAAPQPASAEGDAAPLDRAIADLRSDDAATREAATKSLVAMGQRIRPAMLKLWSGAADPDARARAVEVLEGIDSAELLRLMTSTDGPRTDEPRPEAPAPADESDVAALTAQVNSDDSTVAERALLRLNAIGEGAIFDPPDPAKWASAPQVLHRLLVLVGRDRLAWGMRSWGLLLGGREPAFPRTLPALGHEAIEDLIARDQGEAISADAKGRPERRRNPAGGIWTYCYDPNAPFWPIERTSTVGVLHQFLFERGTGLLTLWRVVREPDEFFEVRLVKGRVAAIEDSAGVSVTFR